MWIPASKTLTGWAVIGIGAVAAAVHFSGPEQRDVPAPVASSPAQATPPEAAPLRGSLADLLANARTAPLPRKVDGVPAGEPHGRGVRCDAVWCFGHGRPAAAVRLATELECRRRGGLRSRRFAGSRSRGRSRANAGCRRRNTGTDDIAQSRVDSPS